MSSALWLPGSRAQTPQLCLQTGLGDQLALSPAGAGRFALRLGCVTSWRELSLLRAVRARASGNGAASRLRGAGLPQCPSREALQEGNMRTK